MEDLQRQLNKLKEDRKQLEEASKADQARIDKLNSELKGSHQGPDHIRE